MAQGRVQVVSSGYHTCALNDARAVYCWGSNSGGTLGINATIAQQSNPAVLSGLSSTQLIAAGLYDSCALSTGGQLACWGPNIYGEVGNGTRFAVRSPAVVLGSVADVSVGWFHTCAVTISGGVKCWGDNSKNQLGIVGPAFIAVPTDVPGLSSGVRFVAAGGYHSCAIMTTGAVRCWGYNSDGQLGDGTTLDRTAPVPVTGLPGGAASISAGSYHTCVTGPVSGASCWGYNGVGQLGNPSALGRSPTPVSVTGLSGGIAAVSAGGSNTCALTAAGAAYCWGENSKGEVGDGTITKRTTATAVNGLSSGVLSLDTGKNGSDHSCAVVSDGSLRCWGYNSAGELGDGTLKDQREPQPVIGSGGSGFLDLSPSTPLAIPASKQPVFTLLTAGGISNGVATVSANMLFRPQDVGSIGSVYVFASAPSNKALPAKDKGEALVLGYAKAADGTKDTAVACVLAQLNGTGQLQAVSASSLQAYVSGVLSGQGQAVTIINGVATANIGGATFFVGYGANAAAMLGGGLNRSAVSIPGTRECKPAPPKTGWWWNTGEGGRGYSIEVQGTHLFYASYLYDASGRSTWLVGSGYTSVDGSLVSGNLETFTSGQTLSGAWRPPASPIPVGPFTLAFSDELNGTMVWPGGSVAIERFNIVPNGVSSPPQPNVPESGWWWNPDEGGRGFFLEWQNGTLDLAGYMYDDAGNPVWYLAVNATPDPRQMSGNWLSFANGQTLTGAYRPPSPVTGTPVGTVSVQFSSTTAATMTMPGGRKISLTRYRY